MVKRKQRFIPIKGFIGLIRPFTLLAPFIVSSSIMVASYVYIGSSQPFLQILFSTILPASLSFVFLNAASNALNQATDLEADAISKPYRPIPMGLISQKNAIKIAIFLYAVSFILGSYIHLTLLVFLLLITCFTITYSLYPRMKDRLWFNQLWIGVPRGFLGILASWSIFSPILDPLPLIIACIAGLFLFGGSITKDISDKDADKMVGTQTLVLCYGEQKAACMVLPFLFFPFLLIPVFINIGFLPVYFWFLTFLAIPAFYVFKTMVMSQSKRYHLENTVSWSFMYITYFSFALSFSMLTVAGTILKI